MRYLPHKHFSYLSYKQSLNVSLPLLATVSAADNGLEEAITVEAMVALRVGQSTENQMNRRAICILNIDREQRQAVVGFHPITILNRHD